jgi:hypothetical protein
MTNNDGDDDISRLKRHLRAVEAEMDSLWALFGVLPPLRLDGGSTNVRVTRNDAGRLVFDRGAE